MVKGGLKHKVQKLADCEGEARRYGARYFSFTERDYYKGVPMCFYTDICAPSSEKSSRQAVWSIYERPAGIRLSLYLTYIYIYIFDHLFYHMIF